MMKNEASEAEKLCLTALLAVLLELVLERVELLV
jgi:hypothetical protein